MKTRDEITTTVKEIFQATLKVEPERLQAATSLRDELQLDSLDLIEVVYEIEERFEVQIPESKLDEIHTFGEIIDGLEEALNAEGAA